MLLMQHLFGLGLAQVAHAMPCFFSVCNFAESTILLSLNISPSGTDNSPVSVIIHHH